MKRKNNIFCKSFTEHRCWFIKRKSVSYAKKCFASAKAKKTAFAVYLFLIFTITFVVRETMILRHSDNRGVVLVPFKQISSLICRQNHLFWFVQIIFNIILFIPFGFFLPFLNRNFQRIQNTVFTGVIFSIFIEIMQYITRRGLTDIDDVINNTIGAVVGYLLYKRFMRICENEDKKQHQ